MVEDVQRAPTLAQGHVAKPYIVVVVQVFANSPGRSRARQIHRSADWHSSC